FSGLVRSACALASAAAMVPMDSLERCMAALHAQDIKAHRTGFGSFGSDAMADRFLGVLGHKGLELCLGILVLEVSLARAPEHAREFRPGVGMCSCRRSAPLRSGGEAARFRTVEGARHSQRSARIF